MLADMIYVYPVSYHNILQAAEEKAAKIATELESKKDELVKADEEIQACQLTAHHHFCIYFVALVYSMLISGRMLTIQMCRF